MISRVRAGTRAVNPALALLAFIAFIAQVGIAVMLPLLPLFATELGATPFVLGLLTSVFAVTNGIGQLGVGLLSDRYGSRRFIAGGLALYASMNALIATAASAVWLVAWRALSGFGGGALIVSERIYLTEITAPERRAFANGILSAAASAGMVAGPAFGGLIAARRRPARPVRRRGGDERDRPRRRAWRCRAFAPRCRGAMTRGGTGRRPSDDAAGPRGHRGAPAREPGDAGRLRRVHHDLRPARHRAARLDDGRGRDRLQLLRRRQHPPRAAALAPRRSDEPQGRRRSRGRSCPVAAFGMALVIGLPIWAVFGVAVVAGAGLTAFNASWYALLADVSGTSARGRVFGIVSAVSNAGIVIGATTAAQLWERVDIGVAMASGSVAMLLRDPADARPAPRPALID
jgi:MFS family permease